MIRKKYVTCLTFLLTVSLLFVSCDSRKEKSAGAFTFDNIRVNETAYLFDDINKPGCSLGIDFTYITQSNSEALKDSLNDYFILHTFGPEYTGMNVKHAIEKYKEDYVATYKKDLEPMYLEDRKNNPGENSVDSWYSYYKNIETKVPFYQDNLMVYSFHYNEYTGGAHGMYLTTFINLDLKKREMIRLEDLFTEDYQDDLTAALWQQLMKANNASSVAELTDMGYASTGDLGPTENFYLNDKSITFYYNVYEITPYVMGPVEITLPYSTIRSILKENSPIKSYL